MSCKSIWIALSHCKNRNFLWFKLIKEWCNSKIPEAKQSEIKICNKFIKHTKKIGCQMSMIYLYVDLY